MNYLLGDNASIVHNKTFERTIVKIISRNEAQLGRAEQHDVSALLRDAEEQSEGIEANNSSY